MAEPSLERWLLVLQPRTVSGSPLAFGVLEAATVEEAAAFAREMFRDHATAETIEVFAGDEMVRAYSRAEMSDP